MFILREPSDRFYEHLFNGFGIISFVH